MNDERSNRSVTLRSRAGRVTNLAIGSSYRSDAIRTRRDLAVPRQRAARTMPTSDRSKHMAVTSHDRHLAASALQRLGAWCYRRRRRVLVLWVVALIAVSAIGSSTGSRFSQGFSLSGTESQRAAELLQSRFPTRAGD